MVIRLYVVEDVIVAMISEAALVQVTKMNLLATRRWVPQKIS